MSKKSKIAKGVKALATRIDPTGGLVKLGWDHLENKAGQRLEERFQEEYQRLLSAVDEATGKDDGAYIISNLIDEATGDQADYLYEGFKRQMNALDYSASQLIARLVAHYAVEARPRDAFYRRAGAFLEEAEEYDVRKLLYIVDCVALAQEKLDDYLERPEAGGFRRDRSQAEVGVVVNTKLHGGVNRLVVTLKSNEGLAVEDWVQAAFDNVHEISFDLAPTERIKKDGLRFDPFDESISLLQANRILYQLEEKRADELNQLENYRFRMHRDFIRVFREEGTAKADARLHDVPLFKTYTTLVAE